MARIVIKNCPTCNIPHEWEFTSPRLKELRTIKELTGLTGMGFADAFQESDPDAMSALIYVLHQRDGIKMNYDDVDLDMEDFDMIESEEEKAAREKLEKEAEAEANGRQSPKVTNGKKSGAQRKAASARK